MFALAEIPWLQTPWQRLCGYVAADRVPQALLITGRSGVGKALLAEHFSQRLLCRNPAEFACGECVSCHLFKAGNLPDFIRVEPEEPGKAIPIDQIRSLIANLALKPQYSGRRVVLINPVHQMTVASANSLLKTLEEPDEHTRFLLLTDTPQALLPTVQSRCQRLDLALPERAVALAWLRQQGLAENTEAAYTLSRGAPFKALAIAGDGVLQKRQEFFASWCKVLMKAEEPVALAEKWAKFPSEDLLEWMISWTMDFIRLRLSPGWEHCENLDLTDKLRQQVSVLEAKPLFEHLDQLQRAKSLLHTQVNRQLMLEELLIGWLNLASHPRTLRHMQ